MHGNSIIMIATVCIIVGFAAVYAIFDKKSYNQAPKKIWTYWDSKVPKTVHMCMKGWAKWNPEYEIVLLTKKNFKGYCTIPLNILGHPNFHDKPSRFARLVQLWTLAEHGGVWIDATVLLSQPLGSWMFPHYAECSGFYTRDQLAIEPWFFACNKGSPFVKRWRDEYSTLAMYPNVGAYSGLKNPIHVAAEKVLQRYTKDSLYLQEDGPLRYLIDAKWNSEKALMNACAMPKPPIMTLRGDERRIMEQKIEDDLSNINCGWV